MTDTNSKFLERIIVAVVIVVFVLFMGFAWLNESQLSATKKLWLVWVTLAVLMVVVLVGLAIVYRKYAAVVVVRNFVVLFLVVVTFSIAPIIFLGTDDRVVGLKIGAIVFLTLLPGWLYLQFVAVKGKTLWDEFVLNLYRLYVDNYAHLPSPPPGSYFDNLLKTQNPEKNVKPEEDARPVENLYERKFRGLYGSGAEEGTLGEPRRFQGENMFPVIILTLVFAVAWALVLKPAVFLDFSVLSVLSGPPNLPTGSNDLPEFSGDALRFGFVGSYFYVLQMLMRRYYQDDLKTSAYINATVRVITVMLLVATLHIVWPKDWAGEIAFAFVIGVFPQVGLQALRTVIALPLRGWVKSLQAKHPLSDLDGMNIWYESRLLEEGVEDLQNLATVNIVDIMLRTRIPVDRLVDWIDQAHLYLRVSSEDGSQDKSKDKSEDQLEDKPEKMTVLSSRQKLRQYGIRSATDLENAFKVADDKKPRWILNNKSDAPSRTETILRTLADEPNLLHVRSWKEHSQAMDIKRLETLGSGTSNKDTEQEPTEKDQPDNPTPKDPA